MSEEFLTHAIFYMFNVGTMSNLPPILVSESLQDALQELKMAIKASGEHKQKVRFQNTVLIIVSLF